MVYKKQRKSPLWKLLNIPFPDADLEKVYLAFSNTIYMPSNVTECPESMIVHESVHLQQQKNSKLYALFWWFKYIFSKQFRFSQELEAYRTQVKWFDDKKNATFQQKYQYRVSIAYILASPMYGNMCTKDEAFKKLGEEEK